MPLDLEKHRLNVRRKFMNKAISQLKKIGVPLHHHPSHEPDPPNSFFKGCWIDGGALHYCVDRAQVGEFLHEAGHLMLLPTEKRRQITPGLLADEMVIQELGDLAPMGDAAVEAWDYAVAKAAGIPELAVFEKGFNGEGWRVWESMTEGFHPGFLLLRALGMSRQYGTCDRWTIPQNVQQLTPESVVQIGSKSEIKGMIAFLEKMKIA